MSDPNPGQAPLKFSHMHLQSVAERLVSDAQKTTELLREASAGILQLLGDLAHINALARKALGVIGHD